MNKIKPTRNLALELVRATEAGAMAAGRFMGRGDKEGGDQAAVDGMRHMLNTIEMSAVVVVGEGEKDEAPMLYNGEVLGNGEPPEMDLAVDPIDGTTLLAKGKPNSIATIAISPRGTMFDPGPFVYMQKIAVGPECKGLVDINKPVKENLTIVGKALGKSIEDLTVVVLERPRHVDLIAEIRKCGARIRQISDGDVAGALMTALPDSGIDILLGIGGSPEAILAACALSGMGGEQQCKLFARNEEELNKGKELGFDFNSVLYMNDLVSSEDVFFAATGITDGELLRGVKYYGGGAETDSLVIRGKTGTVRHVKATHSLTKIKNISGVVY